MFSGIIADIGTIIRTEERVGALRLVIMTNTLGMAEVRPGDSIAVNGACLTVTEIHEDIFMTDVSRETLNCTTGLAAAGVNVNLEKALRLADRLDGHLVSGHVDGVGEVFEFIDLGESWKLSVVVPQLLLKYIAVKGSITINGVSLTINKLEGAIFSVNLIPHTLAVTTLHELKAGASVNLEIDLIARYVERLLQAQSQG